jgi:hypothetical protein
MWTNDPVEYVQAKLDPMDDFRSSVGAAQGLLSAIVRNRFKLSFLNIVSFVNGIFEKYNQTPVEQRDVREKDAAIHLVSSIANEMMSKVFNIVFNF